MTVEPSEVFAFIARGLPDRVQRLPRRERAAFAAACASRLLRQRPPDLGALAGQAVAAAWQAVDGQAPDDAPLLLERLE
jgi:hypothetical protein